MGISDRRTAPPSAVSVLDLDPGRTASSGSPDEDDLRLLAGTLISLLAREGDDPPLWWSPAFARRVASARAIVGSVTTASRLAAGLERPGHGRTTPRSRFDADARRLAGDAIPLAIAIRWLEIDRGILLPSWPELLRRRSLTARTADRPTEAALWFG